MYITRTELLPNRAAAAALQQQVSWGTARNGTQRPARPLSDLLYCCRGAEITTAGVLLVDYSIAFWNLGGEAATTTSRPAGCFAGVRSKGCIRSTSIMPRNEAHDARANCMTRFTFALLTRSHSLNFRSLCRYLKTGVN